MAVNTDYGYYNFPVTYFSSIGHFLGAKPPNGISSIAYAGKSLDFLVIDRGATTTVVMFHAAVAEAELTVPRFVGLKTVRPLKCNVVLVSDPVLAKGVGLGWFAGFRGVDLQNDLTDVLRHITEVLSRKKDEIIFYGPSGGGFAAMYYGAKFPKSLVVAINPQTDITKFHPGQVRRYLDVAWATDDFGETDVCFDLVELYREGVPNTVALMQNLGDEFHIVNHSIPWLEGRTGNNPKTGCLYDNWGEGHAPPPALLNRQVLKLAENSAGDWSMLASLGFGFNVEKSVTDLKAALV